MGGITKGELGTSARPEVPDDAGCSFVRGQRVANWRAVTFIEWETLEATFDTPTANLWSCYGIEAILIVFVVYEAHGENTIVRDQPVR